MHREHMHKEQEESKHSRTATTHQVRPPKEINKNDENSRLVQVSQSHHRTQNREMWWIFLWKIPWFVKKSEKKSWKERVNASYELSFTLSFNTGLEDTI